MRFGSRVAGSIPGKAIGLLCVFYFEKGAAHYFSSPAFMAKFLAFVAIGLLSIIPTLEFLSWRKPLKAGQPPQPAARKSSSSVLSCAAN